MSPGLLSWGREKGWTQSWAQAQPSPSHTQEPLGRALGCWRGGEGGGCRPGGMGLVGGWCAEQGRGKPMTFRKGAVPLPPDTRSLLRAAPQDPAGPLSTSCTAPRAHSSSPRPGHVLRLPPCCSAGSRCGLLTRAVSGRAVGAQGCRGAGSLLAA